MLTTEGFSRSARLENVSLVIVTAFLRPSRSWVFQKDSLRAAIEKRSTASRVVMIANPLIFAKFGLLVFTAIPPFRPF
jgi:hypothetical protein